MKRKECLILLYEVNLNRSQPYQHYAHDLRENRAVVLMIFLLFRDCFQAISSVIVENWAEISLHYKTVMIVAVSPFPSPFYPHPFSSLLSSPFSPFTFSLLSSFRF